ncbi:MAG: bifunctional metallophosphatase/5'-nucleotidase [bacterium]|nr:bifunctional metallophosphatase/5'-nucleotidase [bacterium]
MRIRRLPIILLALSAAFAWGETDTVTILHTNDIHDHARPDYDGTGGLPYVAGYIRAVKTERADTLVLDGGDVMGKGDMFVYRDKGESIYRALGHIGYDALAPGNHDVDAFGVERLAECAGFAGDTAMVCVNLFKEDGASWFEPYRVFDVDGVKVGVLGITQPRSVGSLSVEESAKAIAEYVAVIEAEVHLTVVVCHLSSRDCRKVSLIAPNVDVFVGGHSHELLRKPIIVEQTGAVIVMAGDFAEHVGRLELEIDLDTEEVLRVSGQLVAMPHDATPCDTELLAQLRARERAICPDATEVVGATTAPMGRNAIGWLAAAALRRKGTADIGFCHSATILKNSLPVGDLDVNALFRTGGRRGQTVARTKLTGAQVETYLSGLVQRKWGLTAFDGFAVTAGDAGTLKTTLEPDTVYTVVLPLQEWNVRLAPVLRAAGGSVVAEPAGFPYADAMADYARFLKKDGVSLAVAAESLSRNGKRNSVGASTSSSPGM